MRRIFATLFTVVLVAAEVLGSIVIVQHFLSWRIP